MEKRGQWGEKLRKTFFLRFFALTKVPMIWFLSPVVERLDEKKTIIKIPLKRKTKNHLHSMYFGAMCAAADIAGGLCAMEHIRRSGEKVSLSFKDFHADFLKRAEGDTYFENSQGEEIAQFIQEVISSGQRMNRSVEVVATTPSKLGNEPVAKFKLTLSCKKR